MKSRKLADILIICSAVLFAACGAAATGIGENQIFETGTNDARFRVETVATGPEVPWAFAWLPNKDLLFTGRAASALSRMANCGPSRYLSCRTSSLRVRAA